MEVFLRQRSVMLNEGVHLPFLAFLRGFSLGLFFNCRLDSSPDFQVLDCQWPVRWLPPRRLILAWLRELCLLRWAELRFNLSALDPGVVANFGLQLCDPRLQELAEHWRRFRRFRQLLLQVF